MKVKSFEIAGIKQFFPLVFSDERGTFFEVRRPFLQEYGIQEDFVQENCSVSCQNTIRGMHFQSFPGQGKLLHVAQGTIWDVVVDIRKDSPTFSQFVTLELEASVPSFFWIPPGFAHGFCVLSAEAKVFYKVTSLYNPATEKGFSYQSLDIPWPVAAPILSQRDKQALPFAEALLCGG